MHSCLWHYNVHHACFPFLCPLDKYIASYGKEMLKEELSIAHSRNFLHVRNCHYVHFVMHLTFLVMWNNDFPLLF